MTTDALNALAPSLKDNKAFACLKSSTLVDSVVDINTSSFQQNLYALFDDHLTKEEFGIDEVLELPFLEQESFYEFIAQKHQIPYINISKLDLHLEIDRQIDTQLLQKKLIVPLENDALNVKIATYNPYDKSIIYEIMKRLGKNVKLALVRKEQLKKYIYEVLVNRELEVIIKNIREDLKNLSDKELKEESNTIKMIELIITKGVKSRASDIHFELDLALKKAIIRFRIDGLLYERFEFDADIYSAISSTLKLLSNIDFVNNTKAQDGRFSYYIDGQKFDFRLSVIPLFNGESVSIRILQKKNFLVDLQELGLNEASFSILKKVSHFPHGLVLVTGPTGSGKTTTLYSMLSNINNSYKKILTVEDPVEYQLSKIQQIQVKIRSDITFTTILKSILRHDPDVIMIGEVRDSESLKIAVESALTGHLVFTTLHTNDAISSIIRLKEMGVEDYLVANALSAVHAQRLVRRLCQNCKKAYVPTEQVLHRIEAYLTSKDETFYYSEGCNECSMTGFSGRTIIGETIFINQELSSILTQSMDYNHINEILAKNGFVSIIEDGIKKALKGETSIDEIIKSVYI